MQRLGSFATSKIPLEQKADYILHVYVAYGSVTGLVKEKYVVGC